MILRTLFILVIGIFLSACGFHLRGKIPLAPPLHQIYIQSQDPYGQLIKNLKQYLKMSDVYVTEESQAASTVLVIVKEQESQQLLSISTTQQTQQYNLILTVIFRVENNQGKVLSGPYTLVETRPLTIQSNQILGGSNEATYLYQQMRHAIVFKIMSVLSSEEMTERVKSTKI